MIMMMTCSLMVNGPGLSEIPKREIFGRKRAQALQMGRLNTRGTDFLCKIYLAKGGGRFNRSGTNTNRSDQDGRVSEEEELIHAGNENNENEADDPGSQCR